MKFKKMLSLLLLTFVGFMSLAEQASAFIPLETSEVNVFDRLCMHPFNDVLDLTSEFTQYTAWLMPSSFLLSSPKSDWLEIGLLYAGSTALSFGSRTLLKSFVDRDRPYMYFDNPSQTGLASGDYKNSFPSGHSAMAFTGAAFTATVFALQYPDSACRFPITISAFTLAGFTAGLRVASGNHFMSDVLCGAAIGSIFGFAVPYTYYAIKKTTSSASHRLSHLGFDSVDFFLSPFGLMIQKKY